MSKFLHYKLHAAFWGFCVLIYFLIRKTILTMAVSKWEIAVRIIMDAVVSNEICNYVFVKNRRLNNERFTSYLSIKVNVYTSGEGILTILLLHLFSLGSILKGQNLLLEEQMLFFKSRPNFERSTSPWKASLKSRKSGMSH